MYPKRGVFPSLLAISGIFFVGSAGKFGSACILTLLILISVCITMLVSWLLGRTILKGEPSSFVLELPPYRRPQIGKVIIRSVLDRTIFVLCRAVVTAAPVSLLIWCLANIRLHDVSLLQTAAQILSPIGTLLGVDGTILLAFVLGLPANEIVLPVAVTAYMGASQLTDFGALDTLRTLLSANGWTLCTAACFLILTLFHSPCATTLLTIHKETGSKKWTLAAFLLPIIIGILLCLMMRALFFLR